MHALLAETGAPDSIKSVSLADLERQDEARPPLFARIVHLVKVGLMVWGALSLSAAGGIALVYLQGGPDDALLVGDKETAIPETRDEPPTKPIGQTASLPAPVSIAETDPAEAEESFVAPAVAEAPPEPLILARVPRPRPDEPIVTGSIGRRDAFPPSPAYADPCQILERIGAPLPVRIRCLNDSHAAAPPYPSYPPNYPPPQPYARPW
jgi:hypothetical protein